MTVRLDLGLPGPDLTAVLCDIPSVSGDEAELADAVEAALSGYGHLRVDRTGDTVVARTGLGRPERVIVAGHLDTVPIAGNLPSRRDGLLLWGRGTVDMKGGLAVALRLAAHVTDPVRDVTYVCYDNEEVEADRSGLARVAHRHPDWLAADFAVLMEPTSAQVEGGCNGTVRVAVTVRGRAAHSARWWMGSNAVHAAAEVLDRLRGYVPAEVEVDGLVYREGLNAVDIRGGIAGNVVPDTCVVTVNYRFAPNRSEDDAQAHLHELFDGYELTTLDSSPGARPGLSHPAAAAFIAAVGAEPRPKYGWTDVARFSALGVPAVNYGPGDPSLAHADDEHVDLREVQLCEDRMWAWLTAAPAAGGARP
ncbi:MAG: succinyl-diaminopimelate desuccinylase [Jiangellaceae bacterium]